MNYTPLFEIRWDESYNDPDCAIPGTFNEWLSIHEAARERLANNLEWLAERIRTSASPCESRKPSTTLPGIVLDDLNTPPSEPAD